MRILDPVGAGVFHLNADIRPAPQPKIASIAGDFWLVLEVGLEPTKPYGGRFTVSCDCHYTIPACSWSRFTDSNRRPAVYKTAALTS